MGFLYRVGRHVEKESRNNDISRSLNCMEKPQHVALMITGRLDGMAGSSSSYCRYPHSRYLHSNTVA